jgi:hypothetical protein
MATDASSTSGATVEHHLEHSIQAPSSTQCPPDPQLSDKSSSKKMTKATTSRRSKTFNLNTYKIHALGDYVATIRQYGTTDSYSTEPVGIHFVK